MLRSILTLIVWVGVLNFVAFWIATTLIGGDALAGSSEHGRFYVSSHGRLTEVDQGAFYYSLVHTISILVTHPMAIAAAAALQFLDWRSERKLHAEIDKTLDTMRKTGRG